ncbi:MAG: hypothetical protein HOE90_17920 [Bacteriovoracaceae bacterium]|nr:hypothetical protein [Bacteriovoracaceae bacterium]
MKFLLFILCLAVFSSCASKKSHIKVKKIMWENSKSISSPESIYYEPNTKLIFISNIVGEGTNKDHNGHISILSANGKSLKPKWINGLNAPKGMRAHDGKLWVTDIDTVVEIDISKGKVLRKIKLKGAKFLNDIAISPSGVVYASDTLGSTIYKIEAGVPSIFMEGEALDSPNGLIYAGDKLYVASWGLTTDWSTKTPGQLYSIDPKEKTIEKITSSPLGHLDGLEINTQGDFLVSDWVAGKIYKISRAGDVELIFTGEKGLADIGYIPTSGMVLAPFMLSHKAIAIQ